MRPSGVFGIGSGTGVDVEDEAVAAGGGVEMDVLGGGGEVGVPCIAFSIQLAMCSALNASEVGS